MKYLIYLLSVFCVSFISLNAQCPVTSINLHTQSDVDQFLVDFGSCIDFEYGIRITDSQVVSLEGLCNLKSIQGDLIICENPLLQDLNGLEELESIGGDLEIKVNASLQNLDGLNNLKTVGKDLLITDNPSLTNIDGLSSLTDVGIDLTIRDNAVLQHVNGLASLINVGGDFIICENPLLQHLDGLTELMFVGKEFSVKNNPALTDCSGLCHFLEFGIAVEEITIKNNPSACSSIEEIETACALLPVQWINFYGEANSEGIQLKWTVDGGIIADKYKVEHSRDGVDFVNIDMVDHALVNSYSPMEYNYLHVNPFPGRNYYRLTQIAFEQPPIISDIIMIQYDKADGFILYPLACKDKLYFSSPDFEVSQIMIYDMQGKLILTELRPGYFIDVSDLIGGQYIINVMDGVNMYRYRFIKMVL